MLVRRDLGPSYGAVQGGHALAELLLRGKRGCWNNDTLVYLGVENEMDLQRHMTRLERRGADFVVFREPDIGDEVTALACVSDGRAFSNLSLF